MTETTARPVVRTLWTVTQNHPGYLPWADDVPTFVARADAVAYLRGEMVLWAQQQDEMTADAYGDDEYDPGVEAHVRAILRDEDPDEASEYLGGEWSASIDYGNALPMVWSLNRVDVLALGYGGGHTHMTGDSGQDVCMVCGAEWEHDGLRTACSGAASQVHGSETYCYTCDESGPDCVHTRPDCNCDVCTYG